MWMLMEAVLTLLAALGLGFLVWLLFGRMLHPLPGSELTVLLPGRDDGTTLERDVRAIRWLRGLGLLRCPVVIADVSLTAEGRELARRLAARWSEVSVVPAQELTHQEYERGGGRDGTSGTESGGGNGLRHHLSK